MMNIEKGETGNSGAKQSDDTEITFEWNLSKNKKVVPPSRALMAKLNPLSQNKEPLNRKSSVMDFDHDREIDVVMHDASDAYETLEHFLHDNDGAPKKRQREVTRSSFLFESRHLEDFEEELRKELEGIHCDMEDEQASDAKSYGSLVGSKRSSMDLTHESEQGVTNFDDSISAASSLDIDSLWDFEKSDAKPLDKPTSQPTMMNSIAAPSMNDSTILTLDGAHEAHDNLSDFLRPSDDAAPSSQRIQDSIAFEFDHLGEIEDDLRRELEMLDGQNDAELYKQAFGESLVLHESMLFDDEGKSNYKTASAMRTIALTYARMKRKLQDQRIKRIQAMGETIKEGEQLLVGGKQEEHKNVEKQNDAAHRQMITLMNQSTVMMGSLHIDDSDIHDVLDDARGAHNDLARFLSPSKKEEETLAPHDGPTVEHSIAFEYNHLEDYEDALRRELEMLDGQNDAEMYKHAFGESLVTQDSMLPDDEEERPGDKAANTMRALAFTYGRMRRKLREKRAKREQVMKETIKEEEAEKPTKNQDAQKPKDENILADIVIPTAKDDKGGNDDDDEEAQKGESALADMVVSNDKTDKEGQTPRDENTLEDMVTSEVEDDKSYYDEEAQKPRDDNNALTDMVVSVVKDDTRKIRSLPNLVNRMIMDLKEQKRQQEREFIDNISVSCSSSVGSFGGSSSGSSRHRKKKIGRRPGGNEQSIRRSSISNKRGDEDDISIRTLKQQKRQQEMEFLNSLLGGSSFGAIGKSGQEKQHKPSVEDRPPSLAGALVRQFRELSRSKRNLRVLDGTASSPQPDLFALRRSPAALPQAADADAAAGHSCLATPATHTAASSYKPPQEEEERALLERVAMYLFGMEEQVEITNYHPFIHYHTDNRVATAVTLSFFFLCIRIFTEE